jgi:hypothetical protein
MTPSTNGILCLLFGGIGFVSLLAVLFSIGNPGWPVNASTLFPTLPLWVAALIAVTSLLIAIWFGARFKKEKRDENLDA